MSADERGLGIGRLQCGTLREAGQGELVLQQRRTPMADDKQSPSGDAPSPFADKTPLVAAVVAIAVFAVFVFGNTGTASVRWLFWKQNSPLWLLLLATAVVAIVAERLAVWVWKKTRD
jgi:uncharacterized integral membrane protein